MSTLPIRKITLIIIACALTVLLLALPAYAMPRGIEETTAGNSMINTTDPPPIGEGIEETAENQTEMRGNLGDTDGDGIIEGDRTTTSPEQDPVHAAESMLSRRGGWITAAFCIAAVVALLILIVALIPKKRM